MLYIISLFSLLEAEIGKLTEREIVVCGFI